MVPKCLLKKLSHTEIVGFNSFTWYWHDHLFHSFVMYVCCFFLRFWSTYHKITNPRGFFSPSNSPQLMVFLGGSGPGGLDSWDSRKWKGLLLRGTPIRIPKHRAPNHQFAISWYPGPGPISSQKYPPTAPVRVTTHHASDEKAENSDRWKEKSWAKKRRAHEFLWSWECKVPPPKLPPQEIRPY